MAINYDKVSWCTSKPTGWIDMQLDQESTDFLWDIIKEGEKEEVDAKKTLAGNISKSYFLKDKNDWFYKNVLQQAINYFMHHDSEKIYGMLNQFSNNFITRDKNNKELRPIRNSIDLDSFWVNFQKKHEFNPVHNHSGLFSFVIWLKIPYEYEEQSKIQFLDGMQEESKAPGNFEFQLIDGYGKIENFKYNLGKKYEGRMLFFPSQLLHLVQPFFETDETRVSVSGNLKFTFYYDVG